MECVLFEPHYARQVIRLFTDVFSTSEGADEGKLIGKLAEEMIYQTPSSELIGCIAKQSNAIVGAILFTRFVVPSRQRAFMLSPVAVSTDAQGTGVGQALITFGLTYLKKQGVELVFTYGDPAYYRKTGFARISENIVQPPYKLSQPIGWLAQALDGSEITAMQGTTQCVDALCNEHYW